MLAALLLKFARPYRKLILVVLLVVTAQTIGNLYLPNLNAELINNGIISGKLSTIITIGIEMLVLTIGIGAIAATGVLFASKASMGIGKDLRAAIFEKVSAFSEDDIAEFSTATLITMNTNDVSQIQLFAQVALTMMIMAPIMAVGGVIMAMRENARLSLVIAVVVPLMAAVVITMVRLAVPGFNKIQKKIDKINLILREQITGVRVVRAFRKVPFEEARFDDANQSLARTALSVNRIFAFSMPSLMLILNGSSITVVYFGSHLINSGSMPVGNLVAFITYITQIFFSVMMSVFVIVMMPRAISCSERITKVLAQEAHVKNASITYPLPKMADISLDNVSFGYEGSEEAVLKELTVTIPFGKTTAIIGGTGSGKSTLVKLLVRSYDPVAGEIKFSGQNIRDVELNELWDRVALTPQTSYLFKGTLRYNLTIGRVNATDEEIYRALEIAQAISFVEGLEDGLEYQVDQGGTNFSGGQRQRLAIARALVSDREILIFDDCFSALDAKTDRSLRSALREQITDKTVIIISQRISTIRDAYQIAVLDDGRLIGLGAHEELMQNCTPYREIVASQESTEAIR
ncbi:MAG: ABC transporter ATP-binding protein [Actinomycetota bacterium]|nr:ABC transporter ATP-binding protein [Actinomycetota bacterium]